jgi:hypothetical protein
MKDAAIQMGKALNDPITGISALSRVGITFTDDQKTMIQGMVEAGDVMVPFDELLIVKKERRTKHGGIDRQRKGGLDCGYAHHGLALMVARA